MPLHVAPKPVSALRVAGADIHFDSNGAGALEQRLSVEGTAVNQGGYRSLLGAFELGASSPRIPTAKLGVGSDSRMDLQYVGATSNVAALKAAGQDTSQAQLSFGISTWGNWSEVTPRAPTTSSSTPIRTARPITACRRCARRAWTTRS